MFKSIVLGLLAGCVVVIVLSATRPPRVKPILSETKGMVRIRSTIQSTTAPATEVRLYRIDDLIIRIADHEIAIGKRLPTTQPAEVISPPSKAEIVDAIIKLVEDTIDSEHWLDNGGEVGSIREMGSMLVVRNTPETLDRIEALLNELRLRAK